jgi:hypothetical protein
MVQTRDLEKQITTEKQKVLHGAHPPFEMNVLPINTVSNLRLSWQKYVTRRRAAVLQFITG